MRRLLFLAVIPAVLAGASTSERPRETLRDIRGEFRCRLPARWVGRDMWTGPYPAYVFIRYGASKRAPIISIERFGGENGLYPTPRHYLRSFARTRRGAKPRRDAPRRVGKSETGGRKTTVWERVYQERTGGPDAEKRETVAFRERFVFLDRPGSYMVLKLRAPDEAFDRLAPEFRDFLKSFRAVER